MKTVTFILSTLWVSIMILSSCSEKGVSSTDYNGEWMKQNLDVITFRNGDTIQQATTEEEWKSARRNKQPAWCYYENDPEHGEKYGKLYNWYAVNDSRMLAPMGWKIPSENDWSDFIESLGENSLAANNLMSKTAWGVEDNETDKSGFTALPSGGRNGLGEFYEMGESAFWWTASAEGDANWYYELHPNGVIKKMADNGYGFSVRCIKE